MSTTVTRLFRAFRIRNYRLYTSGAIVSSTGVWMMRVAQDWLVLELTGSGTALGIVTALQFAPTLLLSPYAGLVADRLAKRWVLTLTGLTTTVLAVVLGLLEMTGAATIWIVYVLALLFGVVAAFEGPAHHAFVGELVGPDDLSSAIGTNSALFNAARVLGLALAGSLIHWFGTGPVIIMSGVCYGPVISALLLLRPAEINTSTPVARGRGMIREGVRHLWRRPGVAAVIVAVFFVGMFGMNVQLISALMATEVFGQGAQGFGLLTSVFALGSLVGALIAAHRRRPRVRIVIASGLAFGLVELVAGFAPTYLAYVVVLAPMGAFSMVMLNTANALIQLTVGPTLRGRVMALYLTVVMGGTTLGSPLLGWIAQVAGPRWALVGGGGLIVSGTTAAALFALRRLARPVRGDVGEASWAG